MLQVPNNDIFFHEGNVVYENKDNVLRFLNLVDHAFNIKKMTNEQLSIVEKALGNIKEAYLSESKLNIVKKYCSWTRTSQLNELVTTISNKVTRRKEKLEQHKEELAQLSDEYFVLKPEILNGILEINEERLYATLKKPNSHKYLLVAFNSKKKEFEIPKGTSNLNLMFLKIQDIHNFTVNVRENHPIYAKIASGDKNFMESATKTYRDFYTVYHNRTSIEYGLAKYLKDMSVVKEVKNARKA